MTEFCAFFLNVLQISNIVNLYWNFKNFVAHLGLSDGWSLSEVTSGAVWATYLGNMYSFNSVLIIPISLTMQRYIKYFRKPNNWRIIFKKY